MSTTRDTSGLNGFGAFLASADMKDPPARISQRLLEMFSTWGAILVEGIGEVRQPLPRIEMIAAELRRVEIVPHAYSLPHAKDALAAADHLGDVCKRFGLWPCFDVEGHGWTRGLIASCFNRIQERCGRAPSITLYTQEDWREIDWNSVAPDVPILLQLYYKAASPMKLRNAIDRFPPSRRVLPLVGSYVGDEERLRGDLGNITPYAKDNDGAGLWVLKTTDAVERAVIQEWVLQTF